MQVQGSEQNGWEMVARVNGENKKALVDTGCGKTLVRSLRRTTLEEYLTAKCIHGDSTAYKMAWAEVEVVDETCRLKVVVVPGLSKEMLLGKDWVGAHQLIN